MAILTKAGVAKRDAQTITDVLVGGSLAGIDSHGVRNFPAFAKKSKTRIKLVKEKGAVALIDPGETPGPVYAMYEMRKTMALARKYGIGCCTTTSGRWVTNLFCYMQLAAQRNMIAFAFVRTPPAGAAWGGSKPVFGTNPIGVAFPAGPKSYPIILDFATTIVSHGQTLSTSLKGLPIPEGWFIDKDGNSVGETLVSPDDWEKWVTARALVPFGTYKGWGIAVTAELMGGALNLIGTGSSSNVENGLTMIAIDVGAFVPLNRFKKEVDRYIAEVKSSPVRKGFDEMLLPGEREFKIMKQRKREGIPVTETSWKSIAAKCGELGIDPQAYVK